MALKVGLIDVDGHNFPNLALMRISAYHKSKGDNVEWWAGELFHYDIVYMSKVFSNDYTPDIPEPENADKVIKGGTGYCISLENGKEVFDQSKNHSLPPEVEKMFPDYSLYPDIEYAISMTSRGCPRGCAFCHVAAKEGRCAVKVADVKDFWCGQKEIKILDPNLTACREKRDLMQQYKETKAVLDFTQGLDIRMLNEEDVADLNEMKIHRIHFAWDNPKDDLAERFKWFKEAYRRKSPATVYCLTNYNSTMEENLYRIYTLRDLGYDPYVMIYDKPHAPQEIKDLQRWVNNKFVFRQCERFEDYKPHRKDKVDTRWR
jgi:hypothetical protein